MRQTCPSTNYSDTSISMATLVKSNDVTRLVLLPPGGTPLAPLRASRQLKLFQGFPRHAPSGSLRALHSHVDSLQFARSDPSQHGVSADTEMLGHVGDAQQPVRTR